MVLYAIEELVDGKTIQSLGRETDDYAKDIESYI
jgi:hypothetical protein